MFGSSKNKSTKREQDALDDLLGDLLDSEDLPQKKSSQARASTRGKINATDASYYNSLKVMTVDDKESDISEADVGTIAKSIAGLDDMDANLFSDNLKKKSILKTNKPTTPRPGSSNSTTPRTAAQDSPQRVASPTCSDTPISPPSSARGSNLKRKPVKPVSGASSSIQSEQKPGTAPGKMTDLGRESENLKPGQQHREPQRPGTVPKVKAKYDFGEFDEDDPLGGLSLDEESVSEMSKVNNQALKADNQDNIIKEQKSPQHSSQPSSPRKPSLLERPPTRSGSITTATDKAEITQPKSMSAAPALRKDDAIFSDDDNFLDGLGLDTDKKNASGKIYSASIPSAAPFSTPHQLKTGLDAEEEKRPAKSVLDSLLGHASSATSQLEPKEKPKQFVLDKKYTQNKEEKKEEEDDFLFGNYQPSVASSSRPSSRRSVRFQDDDDIFGIDKPSGNQRSHSVGSLGSRVPDDMGWLEELSVGEILASTTTTTSTATTKTVAQPSSPLKTAPMPRSSSTGALLLSSGKTPDAKPAVDIVSPALSTSSGKTPTAKPAVDIVSPTLPIPSGETPAAKSPVDVGPPGDFKTALTENAEEKVASHNQRQVSPDQRLDSQPKKQNPKDWLGLKDSDSDEEFFKPKRVSSRSPGISEPQIRTPPPVQVSRLSKSLDMEKKKEEENEDDDSLIQRVKIRRQQALANQKKDTVTVPESAFISPETFLTQIDPPRFQGSVPAAIQGGSQQNQDLFSVPPVNSKNSLPKWETTAKGTSPIGFALHNSVLNKEGIKDIDETDHGERGSLSAATLMERPSSSSHFNLQMDQQLYQPRQSQQQQPPPSWQPVPQTTLTMAPLQAPILQAFPLGVTSDSTRLASQEPLPSTLQEAIAKIRKLEIEKQYADAMIDSTRKRYEEEVLAIEKSFRNRIQILEEANHRTEDRLRKEVEELMEQQLTRVKRIEQEKADLAAENYRRLEEQERCSAQETEKLKEKHRQMLAQLKQEHEEAQRLLLETKNKEIQKVAAAHETSRSLTAAVEQIQNNARDLGQLQLKVDTWSRAGLDEREITMRAKDEQLAMMQTRLVKQEEDNIKERQRLEDLIARMQSQNREQIRQLDEERWKLKQEQSRLEAQQSALDNERRLWVEQQAREHQSLEKARDLFLEEQCSGLSHLTDERRKLAEERSKLNLEQKLYREQMQDAAIRLAQTKGEYDVLTKASSEEKTRSAERMRQLQKEEDRIAKESENLHHRIAALEQEKQRQEQLAFSLKQQSIQLDDMTDEANRVRGEGQRALEEASFLRSQHNQQREDLERKMASFKVMEDHIAQEKLWLAKERKDIENLKQSGMCVSCRNNLQPGGKQVFHYTGNPLAGGIAAGTDPRPLNSLMFNGSVSTRGMLVTSLPYESVASSIANDRAVRLWKIQAIKDQGYLQDENLFLESLKYSPYHPNEKS